MGNRAGSPNKNKAFLLNRLQDMYGEDFHPIMKIAANCNELQIGLDEMEAPDEDASLEQLIDYREGRVAAITRANAEWSRIAEYTEPKLKAIELVADVGIDVRDGNRDSRYDRPGLVGHIAVDTRGLNLA